MRTRAMAASPLDGASRQALLILLPQEDVDHKDKTRAKILNCLNRYEEKGSE